MRIAALLFLYTAAISVGSGQAVQEKSVSPDTTYRLFNNRLKALSFLRGPASDCSASFAAYGSVGECARKQLQDHKSFFLSYPGFGNRASTFAYGLAGDAKGNVFSVAYQGQGFPPVALSRHMRLTDDNHTRVVECIKPVSLQETPQGLTVCVPPVNQKQSELLARRPPVETTVCAVLANPAAFNNRLVRIRAYYRGDFENSALHDNRCRGSLWLGYGRGVPPGVVAYVSPGKTPGSEDSKGRRILPIPVSFIRDSRFERFETLVRMNPEPVVPLIGDPIQHVTAAFIGRVDAVSTQVHEFL